MGAAPEALFATFDPAPIASASLAQVHRAALTTFASELNGQAGSARDAAKAQMLAEAVQALATVMP